ncbi:MAG: bacteriohemerythrin, partial [Stellaceae bacterium]
PWVDSFCLGHAELDAEHRQLVEMINDVETAIREGQDSQRVAELLTTLRVAAVRHLERENALLWQIGAGTYEPMKGRARTPHFLRAMAGAALDKHIAEHDAFLERLDHVIGGSPEDAGEALKAWFLDHAIKQDSHLKAIFQAM